MAASTPALFRYRTVAIGLALVSAGLLSLPLSRVPPFPGLVGMLSLPGPLLLTSVAAPPARLAPWLLVPFTLALVGVGLRAWGTSYLRGHVMSDRALHADRLVTAGPFRHVRNPLYLGNLFTAAAYGVFFPPPGMLLAVLFMGVVVVAVARVEADALRRAHGDAYAAYAARVPAFVPRLRPVDVPEGTPVQPDWASGLRSEAFGLLFVLVLGALTYQRIGLAYALLFAGILLLRRVRRRERAGAA